MGILIFPHFHVQTDEEKESLEGSYFELIGWGIRRQNCFDGNMTNGGVCGSTFLSLAQKSP